MFKIAIKTLPVVATFCSTMVFSSVVQSADDVQAQLKQLSQKVAALELKATRAQDAIDIMNLQARYEAVHSTHEHLMWMLFAPRDDIIDENTVSRIIGFENLKMAYQDRTQLLKLYREGKLPEGTWFANKEGDSAGSPVERLAAAPGAGNSVCKPNPDAKYFGDGLRTLPPIHPIATYNIVVADDGQTAKATFTTLGYERCGWSYGKYANDYIKIDGKWFFWHKKFLRGFSAPYDKAPDQLTVDEIFEFTSERDENGFPVLDERMSYDYLWYPGKEDMSIVAPHPYKTWTEADFNWWKGEPAKP